MGNTHRYLQVMPVAPPAPVAPALDLRAMPLQEQYGLFDGLFQNLYSYNADGSIELAAPVPGVPGVPGVGYLQNQGFKMAGPMGIKIEMQNQPWIETGTDYLQNQWTLDGLKANAKELLGDVKEKVHSATALQNMYTYNADGTIELAAPVPGVPGVPGVGYLQNQYGLFDWGYLQNQYSYNADGSIQLAAPVPGVPGVPGVPAVGYLQNQFNIKSEAKKLYNSIHGSVSAKVGGVEFDVKK